MLKVKIRTTEITAAPYACNLCGNLYYLNIILLLHPKSISIMRRCRLHTTFSDDIHIEFLDVDEVHHFIIHRQTPRCCVSIVCISEHLFYKWMNFAFHYHLY